MEFLHHASNLYHSFNHLKHSLFEAQDEMVDTPYNKAAETVECAIPSVSAISAALKRSCRRARIASTRSGAVLVGLRLGAEERSSRPASPSSRKRLSHLQADR